MELSDVIGGLPYRMALAGGWIDQPFVSRHDPSPPGAMVVVSLEPDRRYMDRAGMATGTRRVAQRFWGGRIPDGEPLDLARHLYREENRNKPEPSGSQDMLGLLLPGISRLDYDHRHEGGLFPVHIESTSDPGLVQWIEGVLHMLPVAQRPEGYNPLGVCNLDPEHIRSLGRSGFDCFEAILRRDLEGLGRAMNDCMECWKAILPHTVSHPVIKFDLEGLLRHYQDRYPGAMYSGCGGGYLYVASHEPVPGSFPIRVRVS